MAKQNASVGLLYPGEMGSAVAAKLTKAGIEVLTCLDGRSQRTRTNTLQTAINIKKDLIEVIEESDILISLVPPKSALAVARHVCRYIRANGRPAIYIDCNSVSPEVVEKISIMICKKGGQVVDGAFVGSAAMLDSKTKLYLSGPEAKEAASIFAEALNVTALSNKVGDASALKMCFAEFNKGMVALFLEIAAASYKAEMFSKVMECFSDFYPETYQTIWRLLPSYPKHCTRRVEELTEMGRFIKKLHQRPLMAHAAKAVLSSLEKVIERGGLNGTLEKGFCGASLGAICRNRDFLK